MGQILQANVPRHHSQSFTGHSDPTVNPDFWGPAPRDGDHVGDPHDVTIIDHDRFAPVGGAPTDQMDATISPVAPAPALLPCTRPACPDLIRRSYPPLEVGCHRSVMLGASARRTRDGPSLPGTRSEDRARHHAGPGAWLYAPQSSCPPPLSPRHNGGPKTPGPASASPPCTAPPRPPRPEHAHHPTPAPWSFAPRGRAPPVGGGGRKSPVLGFCSPPLAAA